NIPVATVEQMREIDSLMAEEFGVSVSQMMELAGYVTARAAIDIFQPGEVLVLVGRGNNGGDGLAAARHLHNMGVRTRVVLAGKNLRDMPLMQLRPLRHMGVPLEESVKGRPGLLIDALLGYSAQGAPRGRVAELIRQALALKRPVFSVDIPTGLDVSTGMWHEPCFRGSTVLALGLPKPHMLGNPGIRKLMVGDIGIPPEAYRRVGLKVQSLFARSSYIEAGD
ncbi:MAG: NAD(P)H-hydrate epimerase, partial [Candidatus Aenigmarchaeota archaeon]|nr:NAD(P)H-hydrate epimerase [Candidatus Aenigmarchaeota archaeon]